MSTIKHTPGPWSLSDPQKREFYGAGEWWECRVHVGNKNRGNSLATVYLGGDGATCTRKEEVMANARLIVLSPELLAFVDECANDADDRISPGVAAKARELLKKATELA